jgi:hypothetical protein
MIARYETVRASSADGFARITEGATITDSGVRYIRHIEYPGLRWQ